MAEPFLPWQQYDKPAKVKQPLTRDAIVDAAIKIMDEQGLAALSMRAVAQALGTGPASLYAHVANKEQLVDLLMDRVYAEFEIPEPDPARWREQLKEFVRSGVRVLLAHPGLASATLGAPPMGPNGLRMMEGTLALPRAAGIPDEMAGVAGELLGQYIAVAALEQESSQARFASATPGQIAEWIEQFRGYLAGLPKDKYPTLSALAASGALMEPRTPQERFELGLDIIIRGIASYSTGD
jgi:AcrR family transcriptional regulator